MAGPELIEKAEARASLRGAFGEFRKLLTEIFIRGAVASALMTLIVLGVLIDVASVTEGMTVNATSWGMWATYGVLSLVAFGQWHALQGARAEYQDIIDKLKETEEPSK